MMETENCPLDLATWGSLMNLTKQLPQSERSGEKPEQV